MCFPSVKTCPICQVSFLRSGGGGGYRLVSTTVPLSSEVMVGSKCSRSPVSMYLLLIKGGSFNFDVRIALFYSGIWIKCTTIPFFH